MPHRTPTDFGELYDAKWVHNRLVIAMDHSAPPCPPGTGTPNPPNGTKNSSCLPVFLSQDGTHFWPAEPPTLAASLLGADAPTDLAPDWGRPQLCWIPNATGEIATISLARFTNSSRPGGGAPPADKVPAYTHFVYRVLAFG